MPRENVLITVKTYPTLSQKYDELVCTAGFREDGSWIRIYPIPFRQMKFGNRFAKYQWVTMDLERNFADFRPESYKPVNLSNAELGEVIDTGKDRLWLRRKEIVLQRPPHTNLAALIAEAKDPDRRTSLAVFKPTEIKSVVHKKYSAADMRKYEIQRNGLMERKSQIDMFTGKTDLFEIVEKIPYKFSYCLIDDEGKESTMMIEDWELLELYRKCLDRHQSEALAISDVKKKYFDDFAKTKDLYLFLGTTKKNHNRAPNPFIIIGTFHPKPEIQGRLF